MRKAIEGFPYYEIDSNGTVYSRYSGNRKPLQNVVDRTGYYIVTLVDQGNRSNKAIHRLLAKAFISNPENKPHVNHKDGNKLNNDLVNLEWSTVSENTQHAFDNNLNDKVRYSRAVKVVQYDKDKVTLIAEYDSIHDADRATGVAHQNICKVCKGLRHTAGGFHWKYKNV